MHLKKRLYCLFFIIILLTGCLPVEEPFLPVPTLTVPEPILYTTEPVDLGEVVLFRDLRAGFVPAREEILSFPMNGVLFSNVNVRVGDFVYEGDVIVELEKSSYVRDLEQAIRALEMAEVNLRQLEETHALNLQRERILGTPVDMISYARRHDGYSHQIDILNIQIENLEYELERRVLRASTDGYVTTLRRLNEGDVTVADQQIATIADVTETIFIVSGDGAELLEIGDVVELTVRQEVYYGVIIDPQTYNIMADRYDYEAYVLIPDGHQYGFTTASFGNIRVVLDALDDVISVPRDAVHLYNERAFVFVLEEGLRMLRDIEVGLVGNASVEIRSGLELGELVIR